MILRQPANAERKQGPRTEMVVLGLLEWPANEYDATPVKSETVRQDVQTEIARRSHETCLATPYSHNKRRSATASSEIILDSSRRGDIELTQKFMRWQFTDLPMDNARVMRRVFREFIRSNWPDYGTNFSYPEKWRANEDGESAEKVYSVQPRRAVIGKLHKEPEDVTCAISKIPTIRTKFLLRLSKDQSSLAESKIKKFLESMVTDYLNRVRWKVRKVVDSEKVRQPQLLSNTSKTSSMLPKDTHKLSEIVDKLSSQIRIFLPLLRIKRLSTKRKRIRRFGKRIWVSGRGPRVWKHIARDRDSTSVAPSLSEQAALCEPPQAFPFKEGWHLTRKASENYPLKLASKSKPRIQYIPKYYPPTNLPTIETLGGVRVPYYNRLWWKSQGQKESFLGSSQDQEWSGLVDELLRTADLQKTSRHEEEKSH